MKSKAKSALDGFSATVEADTDVHARYLAKIGSTIDEVEDGSYSVQERFVTERLS